MNHIGVAPEEIESRFRAILERAKTTAIELGWLRSEGEESAERSKNVLDAARAELVLLERRVHGAIELSAAARRAQLSQLFRIRAAVAPVVMACGNEGSGPAWHFEWRRAVGIAVCVAAVAVLLAHSQAAGALFVLVRCLGAIWLFGPWPLSSGVMKALEGARLTLTRFKGLRRAARIEAEIHACEREIVASTLREEQANLWVETRLDLIRNTVEVARWRAATARRIVAQPQHQDQSQEAYHAEF